MMNLFAHNFYFSLFGNLVVISVLVDFYLLQSSSEVLSAISVALESIHAAIGIMAYNGMPKQIYKEEVCPLFQAII